MRSLANLVCASLTLGCISINPLVAQEAVSAAEAAVFFGKGVWVSDTDAYNSSQALRRRFREEKFPLLTDQAFNSAYVFGYAKNQTACRRDAPNLAGGSGCLLDILETVQQAAQADSIAFDYPTFWRSLAGIQQSTNLFRVISDVLKLRALTLEPASITFDDLRDQVFTYRKTIDCGAKVLLVAHSQGNFFGNQAYEFLSPIQRASFGMVSVATPASYVSGGGPYTTFEQDFIRFFPGALAPNFSAPFCGSNITCHFFLESYIGRDSSRSKILDDMMAVLDSLARPMPIGENQGSLSVSRGTAQHLAIADGDQAGLDLAGDFTIESWVKPASQIPPGQEYVLLSKWNSIPSEKAYLFAYYHNGLTPTLAASISPNGLSDSKDVLIPHALPVGEWNHVAMVFKAAEGVVEFFVNGASIGSRGGLASTINSSTNSPVQIGTRQGLGVTAFDGRLDDVRVWSIARTEAEIRDDYRKSLVGTEPGLVGYWRFDSNAVDATGNHNDLTPVNGASFVSDAPFGVATEACN